MYISGSSLATPTPSSLENSRCATIPPPLLVTSRMGEHPSLPTCLVHSQRRPSAGAAHVWLFLGGYAAGKLTAATAERLPAHTKH
jgi:hypothetical protein